MNLLRHVQGQVTKILIRDALRTTGGNVSAAAKLLGINRTHFHGLLNRYGVRHAKPHQRGNEAWTSLSDSERENAGTH